MSKGASPVVFWLVGLVVGFLVGWFAHRAPARVEARDHLIRVHRDGSLSEPEAKISRTLRNQIVWTADDQATLEIVFPETGFPPKSNVPPFQGMTQRKGPKGNEWVVRCANGACFSGEISPDLPAENGLRYKYDQIIAEKRVDGWIIIDK